MAALQDFLNTVPLETSFSEVKTLLESAPYFLDVRTTVRDASKSKAVKPVKNPSLYTNTHSNQENDMEVENIVSDPVDVKVKADDGDCRFLIISTDQTPSEPKWLQECTGTIVNKVSRQIIAFGLPKYTEIEIRESTVVSQLGQEDMESNYYLDVMAQMADHRISFTDMVSTPYQEGVRFLLYWNDQTLEWVISTSRTIDTRRGFWYKNTPSWDAQFKQACTEIGLDLNDSVESIYSPDKGCCYVIMMHTPWTPMVVSYSSYKLVLVATVSRSTWKPISKQLGSLPSPLWTQVTPASLKQSIVELANINSLLPLSQQTLGFLFTNSEGAVVKMMHPLYTFVRNLLGQRTDINLRMIDICINPELEPSFIHHFPNHTPLLIHMKQRLNNTVLMLLNLYRERFMSKQIRELPKGVYVTLRVLHQAYLQQQQQQRQKVTFDSVVKLVLGLVSEQIL